MANEIGSVEEDEIPAARFEILRKCFKRLWRRFTGVNLFNLKWINIA